MKRSMMQLPQRASTQAILRHNAANGMQPRRRRTMERRATACLSVVSRAPVKGGTVRASEAAAARKMVVHLEAVMATVVAAVENSVAVGCLGITLLPAVEVAKEATSGLAVSRVAGLARWGDRVDRLEKAARHEAAGVAVASPVVGEVANPTTVAASAAVEAAEAWAMVATEAGVAESHAVDGERREVVVGAEVPAAAERTLAEIATWATTKAALPEVVAGATTAVVEGAEEVSASLVVAAVAATTMVVADVEGAVAAAVAVAAGVTMAMVRSMVGEAAGAGVAGAVGVVGVAAVAAASEDAAVAEAAGVEMP